MSTFAPPVSRAGFVYHDSFYADVGNLNRHKRASIAQLTALIRPELSNSKKSTTTPTKDQVGHWYEAQLRHYGLPHTKDKNAAKVRLLAALNAGTLEVPRHIERLEEELKSEYVVANRKAKASAKKTGIVSEGKSDSGSAGQKRKQSEVAGCAANATAKKTKVTVTAGNVSVQFEETINNEKEPKKQAAGKKAATKEQKPAAKKPAGQKAKLASRKKATATDSDPTSTDYFQAGPAPKGRPRQTARRSMPFAHGPLTARQSPENATPQLSQQTQTQQRPKQTARRGAHTSIASSRRPIEDDPTPFMVQPSSKKPHTKAKKEPTIKDEEPASSIRPFSLNNGFTVTGVYNVTCPTISAQWPSQGSHLRLFFQVDHESDIIWGSYELGPFSGVLRIPTTQATLHEPVPFCWRGREAETGRLSFARSNSGVIAFSDDREIRGSIFGLYGEDLEFWGSRRPGPLWSGRAAWQYQREWDEFVEEAYG